MGTSKPVDEKSPEIIALENQLEKALAKNKELEDKFENLETSAFSELRDALSISYNYQIDKINDIIRSFNEKQRLAFETHNLDFGKNYNTDKFRMQELPYFEERSEPSKTTNHKKITIDTPELFEMAIKKGYSIIDGVLNKTDNKVAVPVKSIYGSAKTRYVGFKEDGIEYQLQEDKFVQYWNAKNGHK